MRCRRPLILASVVAAAAVALLVAGCGGGSSPGVANVGSSTSTSSSSSGGPPTEAQLQQEQRDATRFAQLHALARGAEHPRPDSRSARVQERVQHADRPRSSRRDTACGHLLPAGHGAKPERAAAAQAQTVALLAFARCLRSHGFPSFPDPTSSGELTHEMLARRGIDLHQPAVVQAADACTSVTHGVITRAVVARFVAGH